MATRKPRKTITVLHDLTVSLEAKREEKGGRVPTEKSEQIRGGGGGHLAVHIEDRAAPLFRGDVHTCVV